MNLFDLRGKTAAIPGGGGILGTAMAEGLAQAGANVAICDLDAGKATENAAKLENAYHIKAKGYGLDAMSLDSIKHVHEAITGDFGAVDILVNAVGGNMKGATTSDEVSFFDLPKEALQKVIDLNLMAGSILPCQVFGRGMADNPKGGVIINISSMNYYRPLTCTPGTG